MSKAKYCPVLWVSLAVVISGAVLTQAQMSTISNSTPAGFAKKVAGTYFDEGPLATVIIKGC